MGTGGAALLSRFEIKYLVDPGRVAALRRFLAPFVVPDAFARAREGFRYPIGSLYLDGLGLPLFGSTRQGMKNRFKLRVRAYDDDPRSPVFCEIKRRVDRVILKRRALVERDAVPALVAGRPAPSGGVRPGSESVAEEFRVLAARLGARPVARIRYQREAYESAAGDPVRVTFDTLIGYLPTRDATLAIGPGQWTATPVGAVVLEVKFTGRFPGWASRLAQVFDLQQVPLSKYVLSLEHHLAGARRPAPPRPLAPGRGVVAWT